MTFKKNQLKIKVSLNLLNEYKTKKNLHIFAFYYLLLPIALDEITKRLQMWLNNPQCEHKEGGKFPIFGEITIKASPPIWEESVRMSFIL